MTKSLMRVRGATGGSVEMQGLFSARVGIKESKWFIKVKC